MQAAEWPILFAVSPGNVRIKMWSAANNRTINFLIKTSEVVGYILLAKTHDSMLNRKPANNKNFVYFCLLSDVTAAVLSWSATGLSACHWDDGQTHARCHAEPHHFPQKVILYSYLVVIQMQVKVKTRFSRCLSGTIPLPSPTPHPATSPEWATGRPRDCQSQSRDKQPP